MKLYLKRAILIILVALLGASCGKTEETSKIPTISKGGAKFVEVHYYDDKTMLLPLEQYRGFEAIFKALAKPFNERKVMTMKDRKDLFALIEKVSKQKLDKEFNILTETMTQTDTAYLTNMVQNIAGTISVITEYVSDFEGRENIDEYIKNNVFQERKDAVDIIQRCFPSIVFNM